MACMCVHANNVCVCVYAHPINQEKGWYDSHMNDFKVSNVV